MFRCRFSVFPFGLIGLAVAAGAGDSARVVWGAQPGQDEAARIRFQRGDGALRVTMAGQEIAEYVYRDERVLRPYFRHLRTRSGAAVTRTHPPVAGRDLADHPTMHPGLWLAFGELGGADFWRNKGRVRHAGFEAAPSGGAGRGSFAVRNVYESAERTVCTEVCMIKLESRPGGYVLDWESTFRSERPFAFGDQEEMGLGVRVATPLAAVKGGMIIDSERREGEAQVWGKQADWCVYRGERGGRQVGVALMPAPSNFRRSWFHARDYGLLVANPFGRRAFTGGEKSLVDVKAGVPFRLRFRVLVHECAPGAPWDVASEYRRYAGE